MIDRFKAFEKAKHEGQPPPEWGRQGVLFGLATIFDEPSAEWVEGRPEHEELRLKLALVRTTFARFPHELCEQLIYRGWWLAGCRIATYHRDLINQLPHWERPPPSTRKLRCAPRGRVRGLELAPSRRSPPEAALEYARGNPHPSVSWTGDDGRCTESAFLAYVLARALDF
jgi:hypothetical protein